MSRFVLDNTVTMAWCFPEETTSYTEGILHALADPVRLHIFAQLATAHSALTCSPFLEVDGRPVPKSTLSQHFRGLRG